jgi:hypothetical protein
VAPSAYNEDEPADDLPPSPLVPHPAAAGRARLWSEEVTAAQVADVAASARAARRAAVAGGSGGSPYVAA